MNPVSEEQVGALLAQLSDDIDVSESKYEEAKEHYAAVGDWLGAAGSELAPFDVLVYPQGSFALGTAIKPGEDCDYDVDAVCLLRKAPNWSQERLKNEIGNRLKAHGTYRRLVKPPEGGRRCWTLQYADGSQFHLDVLPAKPDDPGWLIALGVDRAYADHAVQITCRESYADAVWPKSNPRGYQQWFVNRMKAVLEEERKRVAMKRAAEVHAVPDYAVRTPLQRVVQMLKRQRDVMCGDDLARPISIIITTLAAMAYANEADLVSAYRNIVRGMRAQIGRDGSHYVIRNPVNPLENFADRWITHPEREARFFEWLTAVEDTEKELSKPGEFEKRASVLMESFGASGARAARLVGMRAGPAAQASIERAVTLTEGLTSIIRAPQRQEPQWPIVNTHRASVAAKATRTGFRTNTFSDRSPSTPLPKGMDVYFTLSTDAPPPYEVYWQVVNTGREAEAEGARGLRGGFDVGQTRHYETTRYTGRHTIQAFVVKNGECIAMSRPVYVLIG